AGAVAGEATEEVSNETTDEITDAVDTIDWLIANVPNNNGRVGMFGSSYLGFTSLMGAASGHPNLKACVVAAPCTDMYFEDFNRNGLFTLGYTPVLDWFGTPKYSRHEGPWWENNLSYWSDGKRFGLAKDSYDYFLKLGPLSNLAKIVPEQNHFWKEIQQHPDYDTYRQQRNALRYLDRVRCNVMVVGGWHDEQNLYGAIKAFQALRAAAKQNPEGPQDHLRWVMGPWAHSEHMRHKQETRVGNIYFGENLVDQYQKEIEFPFFETHLKQRGSMTAAALQLFDTGKNRWDSYSAEVGRQGVGRRWRFSKEGMLVPDLQTPDPPSSTSADSGSWNASYYSDPSRPVPYTQSDAFHLLPDKAAMTADQRFASKRPDVLTFVSKPLREDYKVVGPVTAHLKFSTTQTAADIVVKLIDVYPMDRTAQPTDAQDVKMNGYQRMVRSGQIRGRYRDGYSDSKPFVAGEITDVDVELLDVHHTFQASHRMMIQIQSSMFPLFDRNPQRYVSNIYQASEDDFVPALHRIHAGSTVEFSVESATRKRR
ncbi:MAG: CocE/NonD family hydrolase, partial [Planctomycetota bacterium]